MTIFGNLPRPKRPNEADAKGDNADADAINNNADPPATTGKETKRNHFTCQFRLVLFTPIAVVFAS